MPLSWLSWLVVKLAARVVVVGLVRGRAGGLRARPRRRVGCTAARASCGDRAQVAGSPDKQCASSRSRDAVQCPQPPQPARRPHLERPPVVRSRRTRPAGAQGRTPSCRPPGQSGRAMDRGGFSHRPGREFGSERAKTHPELPRHSRKLRRHSSGASAGRSGGLGVVFAVWGDQDGAEVDYL